MLGRWLPLSLPFPPLGGGLRVRGGCESFPGPTGCVARLLCGGADADRPPLSRQRTPWAPLGAAGVLPTPPFDGGEVGPAAVGRHAHTPGMWLGGYPSGADGVLDTARDLPGVQRWYIGTGGVDLRDERLFACHVPSPRTSGRACWAKLPPLKACPSPGPSFDSEPRPLAP